MLKLPSTGASRRPAIRLPILRSPLTDERLARLVAGGSERAFTSIYERYHRQLYRYCYAILHDREDACDALQSTLTVAYEALQRRERNVPLRPWLFGIAHGEAISLARGFRAQGELAEVSEQWVESAEERAVERAQLATIVADMGELPERQRAALLMHELSGLSHRDIARALEISVGAVKRAISDARRSLVEFEQGRGMCCEDVRKIISFGGGLTLRRRRVRAHLRDCPTCPAFVAAIAERSGDLRAIGAPLAPALAGGLVGRLLRRLVARGSGHGLGSATSTGAAGAGNVAGVTLAAKGLAAIAIMAPTAAGMTGAVAIAQHASRPPHAPLAAALRRNVADPQAGGGEELRAPTLGADRRRAPTLGAGVLARIAAGRSWSGVGGPPQAPLQSLGPPITMAALDRSSAGGAAQLAIGAWGPFGPAAELRRDRGEAVGGAPATRSREASPRSQPSAVPNGRGHLAGERPVGAPGQGPDSHRAGVDGLPTGPHESVGARQSPAGPEGPGAVRGGAGGGAAAAGRQGGGASPGGPEGGPDRSGLPGGSPAARPVGLAEPRAGGEPAPGLSLRDPTPRVASRPAGKCRRVEVPSAEEAPASPVASAPPSSVASAPAGTAPVSEVVC
jgi:RNA polymerase sigma factor (sigma-70 family)